MIPKLGAVSTETIDLHGCSLEEARARLEEALTGALRHGERVVRVIHGQGKHSANFPVIKSFVRHWLSESDFALLHVETVWRGEDGSPYTRPNAGETVVALAGGTRESQEIDWAEEEERDARKQAKAMRAEHRRARRGTGRR